jgi:NADPH-dependent glutamate synthase beta subunit-like oxidoreductase
MELYPLIIIHLLLIKAPKGKEDLAMSIQTINLELCTGCGTCVNACPMDVIRRDFDKEETPSCSLECPAHIDMRGYIRLMTLGRYDEAIALMREANPLPAITGHICFHPCEEACARKEVDEAVNINGLERYLADYWLKEKATPARQIYKRKVAIIGSGPTGLAAAYDLVKMGYAVTVFERNSVLGGMLRTAIPEYRLPENILNAQINYIKDLGVTFQPGVAFGKDLTLNDLKNKGYDAVLLAVGAPDSTKITVEGVDLKGVLWGLDVLRSVRLKEKVSIGRRATVIGGGDVAIDAALTARRLGAKDVKLVCLESSEEMPAHKEGIETVLAEGVEINSNWGPKQVTGVKGKLTGIELVRCLSTFNRYDEFQPTFDEATTRTIESDTVIFAIGQSTDLSCLPIEIENDGVCVTVDPLTLETTVPGVFAAGVIVPRTRTGSVIHAIGAGKEAAVSIDRYLRGEDLKTDRGAKPIEVKKPPVEGVDLRPRQNAAVLPVDQRNGTFKEIKGGLDSDAAEEEASRCMGCGSKAFIKYLDDCQCCEACEDDCPTDAIYVSPEKEVMVCWR